MPQMGSMIGYAVTVEIEPSVASHQANTTAVSEYRKYVASIPGPKIVIVKDRDNPIVGSFWGEVNANIHRALGCVGTITDGAVRDVDEMTNAGFKAIARRLCVGHAYSTPVKWNVEVDVFGCKVRPGQLIHADKHGFLVIPEEDQDKIVEAAAFMDRNECNTVIAAARSATGKGLDEIVEAINQAGQAFSAAAAAKYGKKGEW